MSGNRYHPRSTRSRRVDNTYLALKYDERGGPKPSEKIKDIIKLGKAINNATRCSILEILSKSPKSVGQLSKAVNMYQPATSNHLKLLQNLDLVDGFKNGKQVTYKLNLGQMLKLLNKLSDLIKK